MYKLIITIIVVLFSIKNMEANQIIGVINKKILLQNQYESYLKLQKSLGTENKLNNLNSLVQIISRIEHNNQRR